MGRRFVLVGLMVVVAYGSMLQIQIGSLLAATFLLLQVQASPYRVLYDNHLASTASFCICVLYLTCVAFKNAGLVDLADIQEKMSTEQRKVFVLNTAHLTFIFLAALFGALAVSALLFALTLGQERGRRRKEARAAKARRLRRLKDGSEVLPPRLPPRPPRFPYGPWHLFLSHNWAQGQADSTHAASRTMDHSPASPCASLCSPVPRSSPRVSSANRQAAAA